MNTIKAKRRLNKTLKRRGKAIRKDRVTKAWRQIFVDAGILDNEGEI